jgi:hypothetical protein
MIHGVEIDTARLPFLIGHRAEVRVGVALNDFADPMTRRFEWVVPGSETVAALRKAREIEAHA